jgi:hypothetical protein
MITADGVKVGVMLAQQASQEYFRTQMSGQDRYPCGFAWVEVYVDRTNSVQSKELIRSGFKKDYKPKCLTLWNPGDLPVQNVDAKEVGAQVMAQYLQSLGLKAYACSRLD